MTLALRPPPIVSRKRVLVSAISVVAAAVALSIAIAQYRQRVVKEEKAMCVRSTILESGPITDFQELDMSNEAEVMEAARVLVAVDEFKQPCIDIMPARNVGSRQMKSDLHSWMVCGARETVAI